MWRDRVQHERSASGCGCRRLRAERSHTASVLGGGLHDEPRAPATAARVRDGRIQGAGRRTPLAYVPSHETRAIRERTQAAGTTARATASNAATRTCRSSNSYCCSRVAF